jgi:PAS domain S-box-containing protein
VNVVTEMEAMTELKETAGVPSTTEALARSERLRAEVERIAQVGSWEWDVASNRITWSDELFRIFGMDSRGFDPTYEAYVARLHPDDRARVAANVRRAMETGEPFTHTHRAVHEDGSEHMILGRGEVIRDEDGNVVRMVGTAQDITVRVALERETAARQAAEAARDRAEFLAQVGETLAENSLDYEQTLQKVASLAVPRAADWCAVNLLETDGMLRRVAQHGEVSGELVEFMATDAEHARVIRGVGLKSYIVAPLLGRDGVIGTITLANDTPRPALAEADLRLAREIGRRAGLAIDNARLYRSVLEAREQLAQQAREALQARAEAESANRAKAEFLATMSHELRTPINAALGYSELLAMGVRGPVTQAQLGDLDRIGRSQRLLLALVNDILNFARLEAGQIEFHLTNVALDDVLESIEAMIAPQVASKGLLYVQTGSGEDVTLRADDEKLQQVLLNLLTNAVKFTDAGGRIELVCAVDDNWVELTVRDTGRGIAADQLERVFEPFVQVDRHLTHISQQGVGLGLAISRDLMRGMGGDLRVSSKVGRGSTFVARLPRGT